MRDPETGWIQLHTGEFFLVWSALGLGEPPAVLGIPHIGRTPEARADLAAAAGAALTERGLGSVAAPARDLADLLRAVAKGETLLDMQVEDGGPSLRGVGALGASGGVAAVVAGPDARIGPVRATNLAAMLLSALPELPAGSGTSASVRVSDFEEACAEGDREGVAGFHEALRYAGIRPPEVAVLTRAVTERIGGGRIGASTQRRTGRRVRAGDAVSWVDTAEGRYMFRRVRDWVTVIPVHPTRLCSMVDELIDEVGR
jgi:hypothetical protein